MQVIFGIKQGQRQVFLEDGTRVPVTVVSVPETTVTQAKSPDKEGYSALQVGIGISKKTGKSMAGHLKKSNLKTSPKYLREIRLSSAENADDVELGKKITVREVFKPGDLVDVMGVSKGKGFAGGVKRHGFGGGPKTHGQSDRHRAPGSIGQGTTPGRVYKGKRMAGRMGHDKVTVKNLFVVDVQGEDIYVAGLVPGGKNTLVRIKKTGEKKNFVPVFGMKSEANVAEEAIADAVDDVEKVEDKVAEVIEKTAEPAQDKAQDEASQTDSVDTEEVVKEEKENGTK